MVSQMFSSHVAHLSRVLELEGTLAISSWFTRVPSQSNIADNPSRGELQGTFAGAILLTKEWEPGTFHCLTLWSVLLVCCWLVCVCLGGFFVCVLSCLLVPTRPFHSWLLGLPTTSSFQAQGLPLSLWWAQQWTKKKTHCSAKQDPVDLMEVLMQLGPVS